MKFLIVAENTAPRILAGNEGTARSESRNGAKLQILRRHATGYAPSLLLKKFYWVPTGGSMPTAAPRASKFADGAAAFFAVVERPAIHVHADEFVGQWRDPCRGRIAGRSSAPLRDGQGRRPRCRESLAATWQAEFRAELRGEWRWRRAAAEGRSAPATIRPGQRRDAGRLPRKATGLRESAGQLRLPWLLTASRILSKGMVTVSTLGSKSFKAR